MHLKEKYIHIAACKYMNDLHAVHVCIRRVVELKYCYFNSTTIHVYKKKKNSSERETELVFSITACEINISDENNKTN